MEPREQRNIQTPPHFSLYLKCGAILLLLLTSFTVVACGESNTTTTSNLGPPPVTVTITFNNNLTALPTQTPYQCGAWLTNTSPSFSPGSTLGVYAKFVHLVNNNPQGVLGASATATVFFADNVTTPLTPTRTGPDGLAVFELKMPNDQTIVNHNNLVTITFTGTNGESCKVDQDRAAYFTPIMGTPPATPTAPDTGGGAPPTPPNKKN